MPSSPTFVRLLATAAVVSLAIIPAQAQAPAQQNPPAASQPAGKTDADMQKVLDTLAGLNPKPIESHEA